MSHPSWVAAYVPHVLPGGWFANVQPMSRWKLANDSVWNQSLLGLIQVQLHISSANSWHTYWKVSKNCCCMVFQFISALLPQRLFQKRYMDLFILPSLLYELTQKHCQGNQNMWQYTSFTKWATATFKPRHGTFHLNPDLLISRWSLWSSTASKPASPGIEPMGYWRFHPGQKIHTNQGELITAETLRWKKSFQPTGGEWTMRDVQFKNLLKKVNLLVFPSLRIDSVCKKPW